MHLMAQLKTRLGAQLIALFKWQTKMHLMTQLVKWLISQLGERIVTQLGI